MNGKFADAGSPARLSGILTASELAALRISSNNNEEFPYVIGQKRYSRNNTWLEEKAVECVLENQKEVLNQKVGSRITDLIDAEWNADLNVAVTSNLKGKYVQHMGHMVGNKMHLSPEESVFLLQNRSIEIIHEKAPLSLEEAYGIILKKSSSFEKYQVYSLLAQLGFIVVQHQPRLHSIRKENISRSPKRKVKRVASTSLEEEPKEKRSTAVHDKEPEISILSNTPYLTQDSSTISNDGHNFKNTETLVEVSEPSESTFANVNKNLSAVPSLTEQFQSNEEKTHSNVYNFQNSTHTSETVTDKQGDISDTFIIEQFNHNTQKKRSSEPTSPTSVSFESFASFKGSQPFDENVTNVVVESTASNDCTILTAANAPDVGEERSSLPLNANLKPLVSGKDNPMQMSDISSDLEKVKKKYVPNDEKVEKKRMNNQEFQEGSVVEINDRSVDESSSDQDSIEVENNSESDRECDVMSCSSEEDENSVDVYGRLPATLSRKEELGDDDITLVEVKKKEKTPLAVIDILSDEEQTERMSIGESSDNDDEIQIVKVCPGTSKSSVSGRNSYQTLNSIKKEQKYNIKGTPHKFTSSRSRVVFPNLYKKDVVCLPRPEQHLLPKNVKPAKEAYVLDLKKMQSNQSEKVTKRLWSSYKDLQDYQHSRHRNRNADSYSRRYSRPENRRFREHNPSPPFRDHRNDAGHLFQNNFHESQSFPEMLPAVPGREFPGSHQRSSFNSGPMNMAPGMTGNVVDLQTAAYAFANNILLSMMNQNMANSMQPLYNYVQASRYRGIHSNLESNHSSTHTSSLSYEACINNMKPPGPFHYGPGSSQQNNFRPPFNTMMHTAPNYLIGRDSPQNFNRNNRDFPQRNFAHRGRPFPCVYRDVHNKRSWNEVKAVVERHNDDVNDHNSDIEEVPIDINKVLWNSELHPLVKPGSVQLIDDVFKSLQKTKMGNLFDEHNERYLPSANQFLQIAFDVYLPGSNFKKTCPDIPKYRIVVVRATDPIPKFGEIVVLQKKWNDGAILQLAIVDNGDISFYSLNSVQLPHLIPHT